MTTDAMPDTPGDQERELIERMRDDAVANGDYQGAAELDALLETWDATDDARGAVA